MAYQKFDGDAATTTVADVKSWMRPRQTKGVVCPCCEKNARVFIRKLNYLQSVPLNIGWRSAGIGEWVSFEDLLAPLVDDEDIGSWFEMIHRREEWWRLREWQFITPEVPKSKKCRFTITALGEKFVKGEVQVPSHYYEYKGENVGLMWLGDE